MKRNIMVTEFVKSSSFKAREIINPVILFEFNLIVLPKKKYTHTLTVEHKILRFTGIMPRIYLRVQGTTEDHACYHC